MLMAVLAFSFASNNLTYASDSKGKLTKADEQSISEGLAGLGVDEKTQHKLIKKLERGELWDSMNPEKIEAVKDQLVVSEEKPVAKYVFGDGSVLVNKLELPSTSPYPTLEGGTQSCGSGYCTFQNVKVFRDDGLIKCYYYANYTVLNGAPDYISNVFSYNITVRGGSYSNPSLKILIPEEVEGGYPAQAELFYNWQVTGGLANGLNRLDLYVGHDDYWQAASY